MGSTNPRRLVIDASVIRAAGGEDAVFPTATKCRDFLKGVLDICHQVVFTQAVAEEWKRHQSRFARQWRISMEARKKIRRITVAQSAVLRGKIKSALAPHPEIVEIIMDDFHLIEAAFSADRCVISLDDRTRRHLDRLVSRVRELRQIIWVNPALDEDQPLAWLESGARPEEKRRLGGQRIKNSGKL